jgi:hypothetical protein
MVNMLDRLRLSSSGPAVLLFGPLAVSFDEVAFTQLRRTIVQTESHHWIVDVIAELPQHWKTITAALPSLESGLRLKQLEGLKDAFQTGQQLDTSFPLPNTLLIPLIVISHLTQYVTFLEHTKVDLDHRIDLFTSSKRGKETLGFCTGLLSTIAVSSAGSTQQFRRYGAVAVRLGMLIGLLVDAQDSGSEFGRSKSLSVAWNSVESEEEMLRILDKYPQVRKYSSTTHISHHLWPSLITRF